VASAQILIVEDESIVAEDIHDSLQNLGYTAAATVSSGEEAIAKAEEIHPDLVLMDIKLEGAMDGVEAARHIRSHFDIPVIYLTAYADEETIEQAKATESYGYILKPFQERELRASVEMALYKHEMESKSREKERWLGTTLKSIGDAVIATDIKERITFMNPVAETLTGWKEKDALGKDLTEVFTIENKQAGILAESSAAKALRKSDIVGLENHTTLIAKDRTQIPILDSAAPIRDEKGNIAGAVLVFRHLNQRQGRKNIGKRAAEKYPAGPGSVRARKKMPVVLTEEEIGRLKMQPRLKEMYYLKELKRRKREGARSLRRIENKIFNASRNNAIIALLYSSGIKVAELASLNLADVDLREREIRAPGKSGNHGYCSITRETVGALKSYLEARAAKGNANDQALFITRAGERIKGRDIQRIVPGYAKEAGISKRVSPQTLRHSIAIHLLDQGMDLRYVQVFLRHASASSTQIYTRVSNKRLKEELSSHHPDNL